MKDTLNKSEFINRMRGSQYEKNFSYYGLYALFDYLDGLEEETGEEIEFDPCALASDFTEYDSFEEFKEEYDGDFRIEGIEEIEEISDFTIVIEVEGGGFIIQNF